MKKIIPFSKEIIFNTSLHEICSISLEHTLKLENNNEIIGEFIISGDYKETDNVINSEPFIYNLPFDIMLDSKYKSDKVKLDIDNFNYEIKEPNSLEVNITISLDGVEEVKEESIIEIIDDSIEEEKDDNREKDLFKEDKEEIIETINEEENDKEVTSIFDNFSNKDDKYITYHVHIFREKDEIEEILKTYNITKEELEEYNDLSNVTLGTKLIIPSNE